MNHPEHTLIVQQGKFVLQRLPQRAHQLLRAWDAADEHVLDYLAQQDITPKSRHCGRDAAIQSQGWHTQSEPSLRSPCDWISASMRE